MITLKDDGRAISFGVRVIPRARRTQVAGCRGDALLVRLAAPPVDGAANAALVAFLSEIFDRPPREIAIVSGLTAREKRVAITGLTRAEVAARLSAILPH